MDLNFTADELAFRHDIRSWVAANLRLPLREPAEQPRSFGC